MIELEEQTIMSQMMTNSNPESEHLLIDSLSKIIGCLDETNHQVLHLLLGSENDIGGSRELLKLLRDYLICTQKTLDFLNDLHAWLDGSLILLLNRLILLLNRLKTVVKQLRSDESKMVYVQTAVLKTALENFQTARDRLAFEQLCAVLDDHGSLCEHLYATKKWFYQKKFMMAIVLASVYMVCVSMITLALVAVSMAALAGLVYIMGNCEDKAKMVRVFMESDAWMVLIDLEGVQIMVQDLLKRIRRLDVDIAPVVNVRKDAIVNTMIKDMEEKIEEFAEEVRRLESKRMKCCKDVTDTRDRIVGTIYG